jgi:hypothetical protein
VRGPSISFSLAILALCCITVDCLSPTQRSPAPREQPVVIGCGRAQPVDTACDTVDACTLAIGKLVTLRRCCLEECAESVRQGLDREVERLAVRLKALEREAYSQERSEQHHLSESEARSLEPCDAYLWNTDSDATPYCWHELLEVKLSAYSRDRNDCVESADCILLPSLSCPDQLAVNRQSETEIRREIEKSLSLLSTKRFRTVTCHVPLARAAECIHRKCVAHLLN